MEFVMPRYFGCHVSAANGMVTAAENAGQIGVNTIQLHPAPPQRWNYKAFAPGYEEQFLARKKEVGLEKVFFHGIYLINLANPDAQKLALSRQSLVHYLDLMSRIGGDGVIFHLGSNVQQPDEESGFRQAAKAINDILNLSKNNARLILEVAAGAGSIIGDKLEELAFIYSLVENKERVGFGLDTQHMWASGYDWQNDLAKVVAQIGSVLGFEKVWSIHLNDSKTALASKKDRHENLGDGLIGRQALMEVINHPNLSSIPVILETPDLESIDGAKREIGKLREMVKE